MVQSKEAAKTLSWLVMNSKHASASFIMWATLIETSAAVMTVPLAVGVGGLLCWHLYITSKVLPFSFQQCVCPVAAVALTAGGGF